MKKYKKILNELESLGLDAYISNKDKDFIYYFDSINIEKIKMIFITKKNTVIFGRSGSINDILKDCNIKNIHIFYKKKQFFDYIKKVVLKEGIKEVGFDSEKLHYCIYDDFKKHVYGISLKSVEDIFEKCRIIKTEEEINVLEKNAKLSEKLLYDFVSTLSLMNETEIDFEKDFEKYIYKNNIENLPFRFEISTGIKSSMVNTVPSNNAIKLGDLLLVDFGIEHLGYVTDIARTFVIGVPNEKQKILYKTVYSCMEFVLKNLIPGKSVTEIVCLYKQFYRDMGLPYGLPHDIGHGIGIEVHEKPFISEAYKGIIKEGMVLSIEPAIYLESGGIRLEDMVVITSEGPKRLTKCDKHIPTIKWKGGKYEKI